MAKFKNIISKYFTSKKKYEFTEDFLGIWAKYIFCESKSCFTLKKMENILRKKCQTYLALASPAHCTSGKTKLLPHKNIYRFKTNFPRIFK